MAFFSALFLFLRFLLQQCLHPLKGIPVDDSWMGVLRVVLQAFPVISFLHEGEAAAVGFLAQGVSDVLFIGQQVSNPCFSPAFRAGLGGDALCRQLLRDPSGAAPLEVCVEDPAHRGGFLRDDLKVFLIYDSVSVRGGAGDKFPTLHPPLIAHLLIGGDGNGFLLGQRTGNAHHQFGGERFRVDIFFFKPDADAHGG